MSLVLEDARDGGVEPLPLGGQLAHDAAPGGGQLVEALLPLVFLAPFADEEPLALEAAEERVERAFVHRQVALGERLAERVAVVLAAELAEDAEDQPAAPQLQ